MNIFLLTGQNRFKVRMECRRWIEGFCEKHGPENFIRADAKNFSLGTLLDEVAVAPFIAEKRLVVLDGIPTIEKEEISLLQEGIHPDVVLLLVEPKPDRRLGTVKELLKQVEVKEFSPLSPHALSRWMDEVLTENGATIAADAKSHLLDMVGNDQEMIHQDLCKLAMYAGGRSISVEDVELLVFESPESVQWRLMELLGSGKSHEALSYCHRLIERGESPYALWNRLLWLVGSLVQVASAVLEGQTNVNEIAKGTDVKAGTIRTLLPLARTLDLASLRVLTSEFAHTDLDLKTGGYRTTVDETQELVALIDRGILLLATPSSS